MYQNLREKGRVTKGWLACVFACTLAIFACLTFGSAAAFAEENDSANLAATSSVKGGTSFYNAATLPLNTTNTFNHNSDRYYYYKFTLNSDGYISIPDAIRSTSFDGRFVTIYNSNQEKIWSPDSSLYYLNKKLGLPKGSYYLSFHVDYINSFGTQTVTTRVNFTQSNVWERESNDSFETANVVSLNTEHHGSDTNGSDDYFKFTVSQNVLMRCAIKNLGYTSWSNIEIYDSKFVQVEKWGTRGTLNGLTVLDGATFSLSNGTYYLKMPSGLGEYSFKLMSTNVTSVPMYRLYNKWSGEHLFTSDVNECDKLESIGWKKEGEAWKSPSISTTAVYRLYNPYSGDHHYTTDESEYETCGRNGWSQEGVAWYSDGSKGTAVYRLYNPYVTIGTHHYTTDKSEYESLKNVGWRQEGVGWYGMK